MQMAQNGDSVTDKKNSEPNNNQPKEEDQKPSISIDSLGNLYLFIPLPKCNEIFARGMVDMARTALLRWYQSNEQKQREIQALAQKTGFQRFKDRLMSR